MFKKSTSLKWEKPLETTNNEDDPATLEAAYPQLTPNYFLTSGSGPHESLWADCFLPPYVIETGHS